MRLLEGETAVTVEVQGRKFKVVMRAGKPRRVVERVLRNPGHPWLESWADKSRWHADHDVVPKRGIMSAVLGVATGAR